MMPYTGFVVRYGLLLLASLSLSACGGGNATLSVPVVVPVQGYSAFTNPEQVTIGGYSGQIEEPFISHDGSYLFFNSAAPNKDLYFATATGPATFQFGGALSSVNTQAVEGTPTLDLAHNFYFVSTAHYSPPTAYVTLFSARWDGSQLSNVAAVTGLAIKKPAQINFDLEVSADGNTLIFDDGDFTQGNNFPDAANLAMAMRSGTTFTRMSNSTALLANINTSDLEYAPALSADTLELFFTRLDLARKTTAIYRSVRSDSSGVFSVGQRVEAITGFVEGPTLSADEKGLYYHRRNPATGLFELYRVLRP